ncbi:MAG TPA: TIM barrel protein [Salinarimonas sp.]|nr:TIM barrel protein [Salinarimonas sp.]
MSASLAAVIAQTVNIQVEGIVGADHDAQGFARADARPGAVAFDRGVAELFAGGRGLEQPVARAGFAVLFGDERGTSRSRGAAQRAGQAQPDGAFEEVAAFNPHNVRTLGGVCRMMPMNMNRRQVLQGAAALSLAGMASADDDPAFKIKNNRVKQSIMGWTFNPMPTEELAKHCAALGMHAMEGVDAKHYPMIRDLGLKIALTGSHGFAKGPCDPAHKAFAIQKMREGIDLAVKFEAPAVITFTGMRVKDLSDEQMTKNCVEAWKEVCAYAEEKKINVTLEHLNSRDASHPMKGHPGYFGDDVDHCVDMIKAVGSPRMKLLFDIYHVQIMNGDVIRHIRQHKDYIAHVHTAGVPGRGELDATQELNYPAVMKALVEIGYEGFVAQEFIPTWKDKLAALRHAVRVCDV